MSYTENNIHAGPGDLYYGVTPPASTSPFTPLVLTAGVPGSGSHVGHTEGETSIQIGATKKPITSAQFLGKVGIYTTDEMMKIVTSLREHTLAMLKEFIPNGSYNSSGGKRGVSIGGKTTVALQGFVFVAPQRADPTKYICAMIYSGYMEADYSAAYTKDNETIIPVTIDAVTVTSRLKNDRIGQYWEDV